MKVLKPNGHTIYAHIQRHPPNNCELIIPLSNARSKNAHNDGYDGRDGDDGDNGHDGHDGHDGDDGNDGHDGDNGNDGDDGDDGNDGDVGFVDVVTRGFGAELLVLMMDDFAN